LPGAVGTVRTLEVLVPRFKSWHLIASSMKGTSPATASNPTDDPASARGLRIGRESTASSGERSVQWLLKRNCSMAPRQLLAFYLSLCVVSLGVAGLCWSLGATLVMPFAWLELAAVGAALLVYARHATDCERIGLAGGRLVVERACGRHIERAEFDPEWVRIEPVRVDRALIELSGQGQHIAVGRFVRPEMRSALADELRRALRRWPGGLAASAV
jgi:uncharacterized membrane protein